MSKNIFDQTHNNSENKGNGHTLLLRFVKHLNAGFYIFLSLINHKVTCCQMCNTIRGAYMVEQFVSCLI